MSDIIGIVFFATLADADEWMEIRIFAVSREELLRQYLELPNRIPSHDTIERVMGLTDPGVIRQFYEAWNDTRRYGKPDQSSTVPELSSEFGFIRGADYYGRKKP